MKNQDYKASTELYSRNIKAGNRSYYIDAKKDSQDNIYLVLSESRNNPQNGQKERQRIFIYQEEIHKFLFALEDVINQVAQYLPDVPEVEAQENHSPYSES